MQGRDLKGIVDRYRTVTILSHINPDGDAIGSSLAIYVILKHYGKQVEVVNYSTDLPMNLDFLPYYSRIKQKIDFAESLIIACDCGSKDRLGFDLEGREIVNIDHHRTNQRYGILNFVDPERASCAEVVYAAMKKEFFIPGKAATCLYAALLSDTRYFTTNQVNEGVFSFAKTLIAHGAEQKVVAFNLTQRRSLASLRILGRALDALTLHFHATVASISISRTMIDATGAKMSDMDGIVEYARSLVTVEIAVLLVEEGASTRVSFRSKHHDVSMLARYFGGGGHRNASGFIAESGNLEEILDKILHQIQNSVLKTGE
jgi:phosphoesterase RecJ-like protein